MRLVAVVFVLVSASLASADGVLLLPVAAEGMPLGFHEAFAVGGVALETDQRAVIIFRDGRETLVLQAAYAGPSAGLAWIIPVPSAPSPQDVFLSNQDFVEAAFSETEPIRSRYMSRGKRGEGVSPAIAGVLPLVYLYGLTLGTKSPGGPMGPSTLVAGVEARVTQAQASPVEAAEEFQQARQAILNAIAAFAHDNGALPRSLKDLTSTGPIREGLDSSGNPVRLNLPGGRTPYLQRLPIDPFSGRRDT